MTKEEFLSLLIDNKHGIRMFSKEDFYTLWNHVNKVIRHNYPLLPSPSYLTISLYLTFILRGTSQFYIKSFKSDDDELDWLCCKEPEARLIPINTLKDKKTFEEEKISFLYRDFIELLNKVEIQQ